MQPSRYLASVRHQTGLEEYAQVYCYLLYTIFIKILTVDLVESW